MYGQFLKKSGTYFSKNPFLETGLEKSTFLTAYSIPLVQLKSKFSKSNLYSEKVSKKRSNLRKV